MAQVEFGGVGALEGKKAHGFVSVANTSGQIPIHVPVWIANGRSEGPIFCVVAGIQGTEYSGMEAVGHLMNQLDAETVRAKIVAVPCVNTFGLGKSSACSLDQRNINRISPGRLDESISGLITHILFAQPPDSDLALQPR